jgi:hypothetical protein
LPDAIVDVVGNVVDNVEGMDAVVCGEIVDILCKYVCGLLTRKYKANMRERVLQRV